MRRPLSYKESSTMGEAQKGLSTTKRVRLGSYEDAGFLVLRDATSLRKLKKEKAKHNIHSRDCCTTLTIYTKLDDE